MANCLSLLFATAVLRVANGISTLVRAHLQRLVVWRPDGFLFLGSLLRDERILYHRVSHVTIFHYHSLLKKKDRDFPT